MATVRMANRADRRPGWRGYRAVLGHRRARRLMVWGFIARLREGGIGLALILTVRHATGSFAVAGAASAAFYLSAAMMRPVQGRWIDRRGHRQVLAITAIASTLVLAVDGAVAGQAPTWLLILVTAAAGVSMPAVSAALRAIWPTLLDAEDRDAAYALDSLLYELAIVLGPVLVGLIATTGRPGAAMITVAGVGMAGTLGVALTPARPGQRQDSATAARGTVLDTQFRSLIVVAFLVGTAEGPLILTITAAATGDHATAASGPLVATLAVGNVLGMLFYGAHTWKSTPPTRLVNYTLTLTGMLLVLGAAALGTTPITIGIAALLVGLALGPTITTISLFVSAVSQPERLAEAFAWISFATPSGAAASQALAGVLIAGTTPAVGMLQAAAGGALAALFALHARRQTRTLSAHPVRIAGSP